MRRGSTCRLVRGLGAMWLFAAAMTVTIVAAAVMRRPL
jgi:hypothetical protein